MTAPEVRLPAAAVDASVPLAGLVKIAVDFRLLLILLAMLYPIVGATGPALILALVVASLSGLVLLLRWDAISGVLLRHPSLFLLDVVLTGAILFGTGADGPFVLYTVGTAFIAGVLYGLVGALVFGITLATAHAWALAGTLAGGPLDFTSAVGIPALIVLAGVGAAAIRGMLLRMAATEAELQAAVRTAAASEERARLAREMHDTLGKTLHGIALTAAALPGWVTRHPEGAVAQAAQVAAAAETAAKEARLLISDLRSDRLVDALDEAIGRWAREWAQETGHALTLELEPVGAMSASARYEVFTILREALRNVAAHAGAERVCVVLREDDAAVTLEVRDDGCGVAGLDPDVLAAQGHYGLVGMRERAVRTGGDLEVTCGDSGSGTAIVARIPRTSAHDMVRPTLEVA